MTFLSFPDQATLSLSELTMRSVSDLASQSYPEGHPYHFQMLQTGKTINFISCIANLIDVKSVVFRIRSRNQFVDLTSRRILFGEIFAVL